MPFLNNNVVRHWSVFMAALLVLGLADLYLQPEFRDVSIIAAAVAAWLSLFAAGLIGIGLWQGTRLVRPHRSH